jgi:ferredoxin
MAAKIYAALIYTPDGLGHRISVPEDAHVLDAGLDAGLELPYSCLQGWCLTCAAKVLEGSVDQTDSRRYFAEDRAEGFVLLCTARPRSDLVLKSHARDEMRQARLAHGLPFPRGDWGLVRS